MGRQGFLTGCIGLVQFKTVQYTAFLHNCLQMCEMCLCVCLSVYRTLLCCWELAKSLAEPSEGREVNWKRLTPSIDFNRDQTGLGCYCGERGIDIHTCVCMCVCVRVDRSIIGGTACVFCLVCACSVRWRRQARLVGVISGIGHRAPNTCLTVNLFVSVSLPPCMPACLHACLSACLSACLHVCHFSGWPWVL